ncbi:MAG TPA: Six-hairpin glycosidase-like protein [Rhodanobacter sp.]|nr:Six-hairpin glycosidase-like protein [Rhodanobacter sp.]
MLGTLLAVASASSPMTTNWQDNLDWRGQNASMQSAGSDGYVLHAPNGERRIPAQPLATHTASPLFDGLFAMAQDDLRKDSVNAIRDDAFDHGQSMPCVCFETGEKWHYVWTRDLSYAADLGLWRLDPARAKASLLFKLSDVRAPSAPAGLYPMQDTGSGGSWPISTDRIVWFLGARHLLGDTAFADKVYRALTDTLAQDRRYAFDSTFGLYRGETSFLDWREQSYPAWTANDVTFIAQSFALSTNVLHFQALQLAVQMAERRHDPKAAGYRTEAAALKSAINAHFWRAGRGMYMSYLGGDGMPVEAYDLLGLSLAITSGVADVDHARQTLANYPTSDAGSPVIWPQRADQPIYHNRAIWPFVSAYALRAARTVNNPERIAHELRSLMRGAALSGSNMENFELVTQSTHVDDGKLSGPVVDSPRQLWSVAGYLDMVTEGVFGLGDEGLIEPKLPVSLVPMLFGKRDRITLQLPDRRITLLRPEKLDGNLLVAGASTSHGVDSLVTLKSIQVPTAPLPQTAATFAPPAPAAPGVVRDGRHWQIGSKGRYTLYLNGRSLGEFDNSRAVDALATRQCFSITRHSDDGIESLPSPAVCVSDSDHVDGDWPRSWGAPHGSRFQVALSYANDHGPINTGITAAVKMLRVDCEGSSPQPLLLVMPHSIGMQNSTTASFSANAGAHCRFALDDGFNMSYLDHFAHYTGGRGGSDGPLNNASIGDLLIAPLPTGTTPP